MTELTVASHLPVFDGKLRYDASGKLASNLEMKVNKIFVDYLQLQYVYFLGILNFLYCIVRRLLYIIISKYISSLFVNCFYSSSCIVF
jgi:hypothetical protein